MQKNNKRKPRQMHSAHQTITITNVATATATASGK
jgi:hypothetical protein